jgi:hypothetical protein
MGDLGSFDYLDKKPLHGGRKYICLSGLKNKLTPKFDLGNKNHSMGLLEHRPPLRGPNDHSLTQLSRGGQPLQKIGIVKTSRFTQPSLLLLQETMMEGDSTIKILSSSFVD